MLRRNRQTRHCSHKRTCSNGDAVLPGTWVHTPYTIHHDVRQCAYEVLRTVVRCPNGGLISTAVPKVVAFFTCAAAAAKRRKRNAWEFCYPLSVERLVVLDCSQSPKNLSATICSWRSAKVVRRQSTRLPRSRLPTLHSNY